MICKVRETIAKHQMLTGVSSVCAGVSGGADSVALLHVLKRLQPEFGYVLRVVHVNHLLRGEESDQDACFVKTLCDEWGVPCRIVECDVAAIAAAQKQSLETAGRAVRYAAFEEECCDAIAVAHTCSDSIETSLFHIARGTSLKGAGGIPPKNGPVIRPLIDCTRKEVEAYIQEHGLSNVTDSTNAEDEFSRNFVRHNVVQPMKERFPSFERHYALFMDDVSLTQSFLEEKADSLLERARTEDGYMLSLLQTAHPAVLQCAVHTLLSGKMQKQTEREHISLCCSAIKNGSGKIEIAPNLYFTVRDREVLLTNEEAFSSWQIEVTAVPSVIQSPYAAYRIEQFSGEARFAFDRRHWIDPNKVHGSALCLRSRAVGDVFSSPVRRQTKTLKKLFNEMKLSAKERAKCAILAAEREHTSTVIWLENVGVSADFQATQTTDPIWIISKERNTETHD